MTEETLFTEYKSVQKIRTGDKGFKDLAITCVALANAQGGTIAIGFDDKSKLPPAGQLIDQKEANDAATRLKSLCFNVSLSSSIIQIHENGSNYFIITVSPSLKSIASTSDGKFYIRVVDKCEPVRNEDIHRLANEKEAFQWELVCTQSVRLSDIESNALAKFAAKIRNSDRVKEHIKQMSDIEIAENYNLAIDGYLTYLGILWLGNARQRSRIAYPVTVQYIVYDVNENKVRKEDWHDNMLNPEELLLDVERNAIELTYSHEFPDGLFRKQIRHYHSKVIRELLINAFAHKSYTISGDILIQVYSDRLEITNPGGLPLGVTKNNILHARQRRNPHLIRILHDLKLMEGEGSGYDLIYELNSMDSKENPVIESDFNSTKVIQSSKIIDKEILPLLDYISRHYTLYQKEFIALGLVARQKKLLSTKLSALLQLSDEDRLRSYTTRLVEQGILITRGVKKANEFLINPKLIANSNANIKTSLKTIEPHRLIALIEEDIRLHPNSLRKEIEARLPDADPKDIQKNIYRMIDAGVLIAEGSRKTRVYSLAKKK
jgi:ATP-dependent DNA helicase RecG